MGYACTPNMKEERTPGPMMTEGSFMKVAGMSSVLNFWKRPGRKRWMIGPNALNLNCQNGLEKDQAKRLESLSLRMMKMKDQQKLPLVLKRKKKRRRRKKKKRSKYNSSTCRANKNKFNLNCYNFFLVISVQIHVSALLDTKFQLHDRQI